MIGFRRAPDRGLIARGPFAQMIAYANAEAFVTGRRYRVQRAGDAFEVIEISEPKHLAKHLDDSLGPINPGVQS